MRHATLRFTVAALGLLAACFASPRLLLAADAPAPAAPSATKTLVYVGTYTERKSQGIYAFPFDLATGKAGPAELAAKSDSPSYLVFHPSGRFLIAVNELHGPEAGGVSSFAIDRASGKLTLINRQPSRGSDPCHLALDARGRQVVIANYWGPGLSVLPVAEDGRLGPACAVVPHHGSSADAKREEQPHPHCVAFDAKGERLIAADLGLDQLLVYDVRPDGCLIDAASKPRGTPLHPAAGPRHFAFGAGGRTAYCVNELDCTLTAFTWDGASGTLAEIGHVSALPGPFRDGFSGAEIAVHPSGKFVYTSNRGHDSIAVFALDEKGAPRLVENVSTRGKTPRHFGLDPTGAWLLASNQDSDTIVLFRVDASTGRLTPTGEEVRVPEPVCATFLRLR